MTCMKILDLQVFLHPVIYRNLYEVFCSPFDPSLHEILGYSVSKCISMIIKKRSLRFLKESIVARTEYTHKCVTTLYAILSTS